MIRRSGYTKKSVMSIPPIARIINDNPDILFVGHNAMSYEDCCADVDDKVIYIGVMNNNICRIVTATLHELGHIRAPNKSSLLADEKSAWKYAKKYAKDNRYKFSQYLMDHALSNYQFTYDNCKKVLDNYCKMNNMEVDNDSAYDSFMRAMMSGNVEKTTKTSKTVASYITR